MAPARKSALAPPPPEIKVDFTERLPPELLSMIVEYLAPTDRSMYADKEDLSAVSLTCKELRTVALPHLFETVTIAMSVTDQMPRGAQLWLPMRWNTPEIATFLSESPDLRAHIRSLRLRLLPCPIEQWTDAQFIERKEYLNEQVSIFKRLPVHAQAKGLAVLDFGAHRGSQTARQLFIMDAYQALLQLYCAGGRYEHLGPWTDDAAPLLRPLLLPLPKLRHLGTAFAEADHGLYHRALLYADRLILRTAPPTVDSVSLHSWPDCFSAVDGYKLTDYYRPDILNQSVMDPRVANLAARAPHITTLSLSRAASRSSPGRLSPHAQLWRSALQQFHCLTTLTLSQIQWNTHDAGLVEHRHAWPALQDLIFGVVLPAVKSLTLTRWNVSPTLFTDASTRCLRKAFPALAHLGLYDVAIRAADQKRGQRLWTAMVTDILTHVRGAVVVEHARLLTDVDRQVKCVLLNKSARGQLEELVRQVR